MFTEELALEFDGDGRFAGGRQASQPDCETLLVAQGAALGVREAAGVVGDVPGWWRGWLD